MLHTGYIATASERLDARYVEYLPLALGAPPLAPSPRAVEMIWHQRDHQDPGARFFRALIVEASHTWTGLEAA